MPPLMSVGYFADMVMVFVTYVCKGSTDRARVECGAELKIRGVSNSIGVGESRDSTQEWSTWNIGMCSPLEKICNTAWQERTTMINCGRTGLRRDTLVPFAVIKMDTLKSAEVLRPG